MLTTTDYMRLVAHAGPDFMWTNGDKLGTRGNAAARRGLRAFLWDYSGGACVFCGVRPAREMCHIIAAGPTNNDGARIRRGYVPGNIAPGCVECNESQAEAGPIVPLADIARPDLIPTAWPNESTLRAMGATTAAVSA